MPSALSAPEQGTERALRTRQRQKLIDACISALYEHGPSRTTIDKVVTIAGMSPGIVNFYFDTKAALMVAALEFLANEFEARVLAPVQAMRNRPVQALDALIDLYLDPELASPRKVSVWYAFWGEANSRQEYHDICGRKDDDFAALVADLVTRLIEQTGRHYLDADAVALGLIGALEVLWQGIAFQQEADVDRAREKRRCRAYLNAVFPGQFGAAPPVMGGASMSLPGWAYEDAALFREERDAVFFASWQMVCMEASLAKAGDYATLDLLGDRALVVRKRAGRIAAYRNTCLRSPHAITRDRRGHFTDGIVCSVDNTPYGYDLPELACIVSGGLVFVQFGAGRADSLSVAPDGIRVCDDVRDVLVDADWKAVVETWLTDGSEATLCYIYPNMRMVSGGVEHVLPMAPGKSAIRIYCPAWSAALGEMMSKFADIAASLQVGLRGPAYMQGQAHADSASLTDFWKRLRTVLPRLR